MSHMFSTEQGFWVSPDLQNQNFWKNYNHLCLKLPQTIKKHYFVFSLNWYKLLLWGKCPILWIHEIHTMHSSNRDLRNLQNIQILMVWMWNFPYKLSQQHKKQNPSEISLIWDSKSGPQLKQIKKSTHTHHLNWLCFSTRATGYLTRLVLGMRTQFELLVRGVF